MDGHSRTDGKDFDEQQTRYFKLRLSFNKESSGRKLFVIHASTSQILFGGLKAIEFLEHLGFHSYSGMCRHYHDNCMYLETWQLPQNDDGFPRETEFAHEEFKRLAQDIDGMYENMKEVAQKLSRHMELFPLAARYQDQSDLPVLNLSGEEPGWLEQHKVEAHKDTKKQLKEAKSVLQHFDTISYVLWGTGDLLVDAVQFLLKDIGFAVEKTPKGFTVDLIGEYPEVGKFAIEVTGLNDAVKKKTNKINQAISFIQEHQDKERVVILANTFNDLPPEERLKKEQFSTDALKIMTGLEIVGMTCVDLYDMWKAIKFNGKSVSEIFKDVFNHEGGLYSYKP